MVVKPQSESGRESVINSSFIILKPDVDKTILQMTVKEDTSIFNHSLNSVGSAEEAKQAKRSKSKGKYGAYLGEAEAQEQEEQSMVQSDTMSV